MSAYLSYLYRSGEKRVCGQIVTFESRRGEKMFERYGFKVLNRARDHQIQSVLSRIGLPQHRHQELGNGRPAFRLLTRTRVTRNRRAERSGVQHRFPSSAKKERNEQTQF